MTLHRADVARMAAQKADVTQVTARKVLDALTDVIELSIICGEPVTLKGFGSFQPRALPPMSYKVPLQRGIRTQREVSTDGRLSVSFQPGRTLRARLNKVAVPDVGTGTSAIE